MDYWKIQNLRNIYMVAYNRDDRANHFYLIEEDRLNIPDFIPDSKPVVDTSIVDRLKTVIKSIRKQ